MRTLSEQAVLKKLDIPDFRHMTKEKVIKFASILPYMDPEVAKEALKQFPNFKDMALNITKEYRIIIDKIIEKNAEGDKAFYDACNGIIVSMQKQLDKENLNFIERRSVQNKIIEVAKMIGDHANDNKNFLLKVAVMASGVIVTIVGIGATLLGAVISRDNRNS